MSGFVWPSREEWVAKAEYSVRTACTAEERLEKGAVWSTLSEDVELEEWARRAAKALRPLLTAEIGRLRAELPDRPSGTDNRVHWFLALPPEQNLISRDLSALEGMRTAIGRSIREEVWGTVGWHLGRIRRHYPAITLDGPLLAASDRMDAIGQAVEERRRKAAVALEEAAVAAEVAKRATDAGWEQELRRRRRIDDAGAGVTIHRV